MIKIEREEEDCLLTILFLHHDIRKTYHLSAKIELIKDLRRSIIPTVGKNMTVGIVKAVFIAW